jgi:hypothetical protein
MLSRRKTSFLIYEDGRGFGVADALGTPGVPAFERPTGMKTNRYYNYVRNILGYPARKADMDAPHLLRSILQREMSHEFGSLRGYPMIIDHYYSAMKEYINILKIDIQTQTPET